MGTCCFGVWPAHPLTEDTTGQWKTTPAVKWSDDDIRTCSYKVRQTRFIVSHQILRLCAGGRPLSTILYQQMLCPRQIYSIMAIKSGRVIAWKVIMTVRALMRNNKSSLPSLIFTTNHTASYPYTASLINSQAFPFSWTQTKEQKMGEAWERG